MLAVKVIVAFVEFFSAFVVLEPFAGFRVRVSPSEAPSLS
jgi:hypothetical protein